jgi:hypothetical protein
MPEFSVISREAVLEHRRKQQDIGFTFPLAATSLGMDEPIRARVRRLSLLDKAAVDRLSQDAQELVWAGIKVMRDERKRRERSGDDEIEPETLEESLAQSEKTMPAANAFCVASFIEPRLVATQREVAQVPGSWWVEDIHEDDRLAFWIACNDSSSDQAKRLKMFRPSGTIEASGFVQGAGSGTASPSTRPDVPVGEVEPVAATTKYVTADAG